MSEENETLREAALAASAGETSVTDAFNGMSAGDVGGAAVPDVQFPAQIETEDEGAARGLVEDTGITADEDETEIEAAVEAGEIEDAEKSGTVFLLTSASYGVVGQGVHVVGVFESEEAAIGYRDGAEPRVSDGVITEYAVE